VVIVHGLGGRKEDWLDVAKALARRHTVFTVDLLGFGQSSRNGDRLTIGMQAEAIVALLDAEGLARANVVGNSLGGWVAATFAARSPDRIARLAMIDVAGLKVTLSGPPPVNFAPDSVAEMAALLRTVIETPAFHSPAQAELALASFRASGAAVSIGRLFAGFADPATADLPLDPLLPAIRAPTLVMWGANDRLFPSALADVVVAGVAGASRILIPDAGHFAQIDNAAAVIAGLVRFLD
jgi:triacylglycerol lipase